LTAPKALVWDTCVFMKYVVGASDDPMTDHINAHVADARRGESQIFYSTIVHSEWVRNSLGEDAPDNFDGFLDDLSAAFTPVTVDVNIARMAGELRAVQPVNHQGNTSAKPRILQTPDAIQIATALYVRDAYGFADIELHSFDMGRGKTPEGRPVPIVGFEKWYPADLRNDTIKAACDLKKSKPAHPNPGFPGMSRKVGHA